MSLMVTLTRSLLVPGQGIRLRSAAPEVQHSVCGQRATLLAFRVGEPADVVRKVRFGAYLGPTVTDAHCQLPPLTTAGSPDDQA